MSRDPEIMIFPDLKTALACLAALVAGAGALAGSFPVVQSETAFLDACEQDWVQREPASASWARGECAVKWRWATEAGPMAEAILALSRAEGAPAPAPDAAQALVAAAGLPLDVTVTQVPQGLRFAWQKPGSEGRFNLTRALRSRGVGLQSLGCPQYPGASMGREKVMLATVYGRQPFVVTVYSRAAPTGFEPGVYEVDADFSGDVPDMAALQAGLYPGGGGRAFAVDPTGWVADCPDPE
jgi:hypothetical protein